MSTRGVISILVILVVTGAAWLYFHKEVGAPTTEEVVRVQSLRDLSFMLDGQMVQLQDGIAQTPAAPGSASMITTRYFGNEATADFDGNGREDKVFLVTREEGGSGTFFYVVAGLSGEDGYSGTNAVFLGDRIAPQTTEVGRDDSGVTIVVNYADRGADEPMTTAPHIGVSRHFRVSNGVVAEITNN